MNTLFEVVHRIIEEREKWPKHFKIEEPKKRTALVKKGTNDVYTLEDIVKKKLDLKDFEAKEISAEIWDTKIRKLITGKEDGQIKMDDVDKLNYIKSILIQLAGDEEFKRVKRNLMQNRSKARKTNDEDKEEEIEKELEELYQLFGKEYKPKK